MNEPNFRETKEKTETNLLEKKKHTLEITGISLSSFFVSLFLSFQFLSFILTKNS